MGAKRSRRLRRAATTSASARWLAAAMATCQGLVGCSSDGEPAGPTTTLPTGGSSAGGAGGGGAATTTTSTGGGAGAGGTSPTDPEPPGLLPDIDPYVPPSDAIHVDPTNVGDAAEDGSLDHPFDALLDVTWSDGIVVALKRGTTLETDVVEIRASNVILASYGEATDPRPIVHCTAVSGGGDNRYAIYTSARTGVTIRDLDIYAPDATSSILLKDAGSSGHEIINCALHGGGWGLRVFDTDGLRVHNTEVYDIDDDGMFLQRVTHLEISHAFVHDVNQNWVAPYTPQSEAAGDGIQLSDCNHWHVHHCLIDRTNSGNKFCFIANNPAQDDGLFEHNLLRGPLTTGDGGASIYFHDGSNLVVRYNFVEGPSPGPLYSHAANLQIYGNVFTGMSSGVFASHSAQVDHNVFHALPGAVSGGAIVARNNVFDLLSPTDGPFGTTSSLEESHNLFASGTPTAASFAGDPAFVDPVAGNFRLTPGSDCIDTGVAVGIDHDADGVAIPQGAAPDVGAYEYVQGG